MHTSVHQLCLHIFDEVEDPEETDGVVLVSLPNQNVPLRRREYLAISLDSMAKVPKYLTGDPVAINDFINRFDVRDSNNQLSAVLQNPYSSRLPRRH